MNFDFGEVLTRAWQIIWKHRVLWIFGILAGCAQGRSGGNFGNGGGGSGGRGGDGGFNPNSPEFSRNFEQMTQWIQQHLWVVILVVLFILLLSLLITFLGYMGKIALVKGASKADKGAEKLGFGELWSESMPFFWRVFGLAFIIGLIFLIIFIPFIVIGVLTGGFGFLCLVPLLCLFIPTAIVVNLVLEQSDAAIVLEDLSMMDGFKRGWDIFKNNWVSILVMWLILGIGGGIIGLIFAIPILIIVVPVIIAAIQGTTTLLWVAGLCFVVYLPVMITLSGILTAYVQTAWTLTFMRLSKPAESEDNKPVIAPANA